MFERHVVSYSISTSNHNDFQRSSTRKSVVSYSISTSNHNLVVSISSNTLVVSYSISTSNHNFGWSIKTACWLYLIPFLHQTTTLTRNGIAQMVLYLIPFLHQTTTFLFRITRYTCCILFHFYIKPQLAMIDFFSFTVVSYSISTSNHNKSVAR